MSSKNTQKGNSKKHSEKKSVFKGFFNKFSNAVTKATGKPVTFIIAISIIIIWAFSGPIFNYSDTWQLIINTGTTIITFLMVFVIQHSQNKDTAALHVKLDELIAASGSSNELIDVEALDDEELDALKKFYASLRAPDNRRIKNAPPSEKIKARQKEVDKKSNKSK